MPERTRDMTAGEIARPVASEAFRRFLQVARGAGLRVSVAEGIDAMHAVEVVGFAHRQTLKDTLSLVLAKSVDEKAVFETCFDQYFRREAMKAFDARLDVHEQDGVPSADADPPAQGGGEAQRAGAGLARMLLDNDRAGLATAMEEAADATGLSTIRHLTQRNFYARQILEHMGAGVVQLSVSDLRASGRKDDGALAEMLSQRLAMLRQTAGDYVERHLLMFGRGETEAFRESLLKNARLSNIAPRDIERMRVLVRAMAKVLAARHAKPRHRRRRGQLDVRRTLRRNMAWGGVPFLTAWKQKRIEKPQLMVLCDVSGSVAATAQFLLMFLYSVHEALSGIRSFAFSGSMVEVSHLLESLDIEAAGRAILSAIGNRSSNYGQALASFEAGWGDAVTSHTTLIVLGDARGNRTDPRADVLARLSQKAKRIIWLNPEYRTSWGTGDSEMLCYLRFCQHARECSTLRHMERVVTELLEHTN